MTTRNSKKGRPRKPVMPPTFQDHLHDSPSYLDDCLPRGERSKNIYLLAQTIKAMEHTKCLTFTVEEFQRLFSRCPKIKHGISTVQQALKRYGIKRPRVVFIQDRIHVTKGNDI